MDVQLLKDKILEEDKIDDILTELGCHHIKHNSGYITCGNPDGDNTSAITIYLNENLTCINYTREMLPSGQTRTTDLLDLVTFVRGCSFFHAIQWICGICGWDYYAVEEELPSSLEWLHYLTKMNKESTIEEEDNTPVKPIDEKILDYYLPVGNYLFEKDNISLSTQDLFEIGYDPRTNRVTIPIRSEIGDLVGVKGRILNEEIDEGESKYVYLQPCSKSKILYGLNINMDNIIRFGKVFVAESEKAIMQMYEMGYYGVATGGSKISKHQINMLTRLGVQIIFAYDKDVSKEQLDNIASQFVEGVPVYAIIDDDDMLGEKQSPSDDGSKWLYLIKNNIYKLR